MKKVSIITVNYNQTQVTLDLLMSIQAQDYCYVEVIVVDNASLENPQDEIMEAFPNTVFIRSEQNLGFAGGNNLGIQEATGHYLFFVNNDTVIPSGTISHLVRTFEAYPDNGAVCPLIYYYDFPDITQYAGYTRINTLTGRNKAVGHKEATVMQERVTETAFAHGAAMMVSREVIAKVGPMPEAYFLYYEELDWGAAMHRAGFKIRVDYQAHILHKESVSTGKSSPLKTYFQTRNRILFMRRNFNWWHRALFCLFFAVAAIPKNTLSYLLKNEKEHLRAFLNGIWWNMTNGKNSTRLGYKYDSMKT